MTYVERKTVEGIPYVYRAADDKDPRRTPHVILYHQFTLAKEHMDAYGERLLQKGISSIAVDLPFHGAREEGYFSQSKEEQWKNQWKILVQGAKEANTLREVWNEEGRADERTPWGIAGISLGAMVAYGSLAAYHWLQTGLLLIGSPTWEKFLRNMLRMQKVSDVDESIFEGLRPWDPIRRWEALAERDFLMINAKQDLIVPGTGSRELMNILRERGKADRARLMEYEDVGHRVTDDMMREGMSWLEERMLGRMEVNP